MNDGPMSSPHRNDPQQIRHLLTTPATWAVVGLSDNSERTAWGIAAWLQGELGMTLVPVHPKAEPVHGEQGYASLSGIPDSTPVQVVDVFVNSDRAGEVVDEAIRERERLGIEAVWLQLGVVDEDAAQRAAAAGLTVVMDTCPRIEHPRLSA